ncbi:MAG: RDD family protein [Sphingobacteriales bacterium]|nr:MAG: RDD family protein [Sphingobacteriales bacterium]
MANDAYYLVVNGKPEGPFTLQQLLVQQISPNSFLKKTGMDDFKQAHEIEEIRNLLSLKPQFTAPQYFAGFDIRLLAAVIDWFIIIGSILTIDLLYISLTNNQTQIVELLIYSITISPVSKFGYQVIMEIYWQATIGKKLLSLKVTNLKGQKPNGTSIILRNLSKILSSLPFFIGYLYSFLNTKQQCFHDVIAGTLVIKDRLI